MCEYIVQYTCIYIVFQAEHCLSLCLYIHSLSDRSFNDIMQYPVMPWVVADYTSSTLGMFMYIHVHVYVCMYNLVVMLIYHSASMAQLCYIQSW